MQYFCKSRIYILIYILIFYVCLQSKKTLLWIINLTALFGRTLFNLKPCTLTYVARINMNLSHLPDYKSFFVNVTSMAFVHGLILGEQ